MIINRRPGESEEAYLARLAEVHKSLGYGDVPPGWPTPNPADKEPQISDDEEEERVDGDS